MTSNILVTGGAGFVGRALSEELKGNGYNPVVYDLVLGDDIRDRFKLDRLFETGNFSAVINLSARAGVRRGEDFPEEYFSTNVLGLKNLIDLSEKYGVKKFIHYSSSSVFGRQDKDKATNEDDEKKPKSIYGITKLAGELLLENSSLDYTIIRPFTIIGKDGRAEMVVYKWLNQILNGKPVSFYGDGSSFRGYTSLDDIIRGTIYCLNTENANRQSFNLGGDQKVTLDEMWKIFNSVFPGATYERLPMPNVDQPYSFADTSKARKILGWEHKTDIKETIRMILASEKPLHTSLEKYDIG